MLRHGTTAALDRAPHHRLRVGTVAALAYIMTAPGQTAAVSVLVDPMVDELGISRSAISTAYLLGTLTSAAAMPFVGRALDRFGARPVLAAIGAVFGAVLIGLSLATGVVGLTAGFVGIRLAGQGALTLAATTLVAYYVTERLGSVIGWVTALGSAGISLIPLLLERIVAAEGFRTAWAVQGVAVWMVVVPLALWGLPRRLVAAVSEPRGGTSQHASLGPVLREPMFWVITAGVGVLALVSTALTFHQVDVLGERGLSPAAAAATFLPQTIAGMAATLAAGRLLDRSSPRPVMLGSMAAMAGALALAGYLTPGWQAVLYGGLLGVAGNTFRTVEAAALPRYFGTARIGAVRGLVHAVTVGGSAIGPVLLALGHDIAHTYRPLLLALIVLPAALAVTVLVVREPATAAPARTNPS